MKRVLLLFLIIISQLCGFSQRINGIIIDQNNFPLKSVTIVNKDRNTGTTSDYQGKFSISAKENELISFSYVGKKTVFYRVKNYDTAIILITLKEDLEKLKEFSISSNRIKKVSAENDENIIDYTSLGKNTLLILKRKRQEYQLTIQGVDTVYKTFIISNIKPKELYLDFLGNIQLICRDSIRQINLGEKLDIISTISKKRFNLFIKPTIYKNDSSLYVYNYSSHNKNYKIIKETRLRKKVVYQSFDSIRSRFNDHYVWIKLGQPKINKAGNLNTKSLYVARQQFNDLGFYEKILSRKLFVSTFSTKSTLLVFDLFSDSLIAFNKNGGKIYTKSLKEVKDLTPKYILQDLENASKFYTVTEEKGIYSYYFIDLLSGKPDLVLQLNELNFPKKLKIIEGWLYFIKPLKNGLHKLYRVQLEIN